ncbi:MAG: hypothetical protein H0V72_19250 [Bradyrhizobium sp.]|nr:hypothetical protein [Bradyrhizobium sp.]
MDGLLWVIIIIMSSVVAVVLGMSAAREMQPHIPPQFSDPLMSRYAFGVLIFEPRIPLEIQFKALCSGIGMCVALGCGTVLALLKSDKGAFVALFAFAAAIYGLIVAVRKYRANRRITPKDAPRL